VIPVAAAVTVQLPPSVQVCPFTVVEALARSVFVTRPIAVKDEVTVNPETEGDVISTTFPDPVVPRLPSVPLLSYKIYPLVPLDTVVVPTVIPVAVTVQLPPKVQVCPFTVVEALVRSEFVTRPVAVKDEVTINPEIEGDVASTTLPLPVVAKFPKMPALSYRM
jgi:hypothetical protein